MKKIMSFGKYFVWGANASEKKAFKNSLSIRASASKNSIVPNSQYGDTRSVIYNDKEITTYPSSTGIVVTEINPVTNAVTEKMYPLTTNSNINSLVTYLNAFTVTNNLYILTTCGLIYSNSYLDITIVDDMGSLVWPNTNIINLDKGDVFKNNIVYACVILNKKIIYEKFEGFASGKYDRYAEIDFVYNTITDIGDDNTIIDTRFSSFGFNGMYTDDLNEVIVPTTAGDMNTSYKQYYSSIFNHFKYIDTNLPNTSETPVNWFEDVITDKKIAVTIDADEINDRDFEFNLVFKEENRGLGFDKINHFRPYQFSIWCNIGVEDTITDDTEIFRIGIADNSVEFNDIKNDTLITEANIQYIKSDKYSNGWLLITGLLLPSTWSIDECKSFVDDNKNFFGLQDSEPDFCLTSSDDGGDGYYNSFQMTPEISELTELKLKFTLPKTISISYGYGILKEIPLYRMYQDSMDFINLHT